MRKYTLAGKEVTKEQFIKGLKKGLSGADSYVPKPSDILMENIAALDALKRLDFSQTVIDRIERAVNSHGALLEAVTEALCWLDPDCKLDGVKRTDYTSDRENMVIDLYRVIAQAEGK